MAKRKRRRRSRRRPVPRIKVIPSAEIENRIAQEITRASILLGDLNTDNLLDSPYLVSAIFYHDGLLDSSDENKPDADPAGRIVGHILRRFSPETKQHFVQLLLESCACLFSELSPGRFLIPVPYERPLRHGRGVHPFAIDLFVEEGTPVQSATRGIVVLAENCWENNAWFSTSSVRGGNTVIIFGPDRSRFLRYAHLERASVATGAFVESGDVIGIVGHTGFNANRPKHGRHLHFEINEYAAGKTTAVPHEMLEALLEAAIAACPRCAPLVEPQTDPE